jgi:hypothetical protein
VGKKSIVYNDGSKIYCETSPGDVLNHTLFGTLTHQFIDRIDYFDDTNGLVGWYEPGKRNVQDYIVGAIEQDGERICEIYGNYCGFLEFDGDRYWDVRDTIKFKVAESENDILPSDSRYRQDLVSFKKGDVEEAQNFKEKLELDQRHDAKLRSHH